MLCEYNSTDDQIAIAEAMLFSYNRLLPTLYNVSEATFNAHAITHLAEQVRQHGPLILHSAFVFESMLAHLKRLFHGTQGIPDQICKKLAVAQHLEPQVFNALKDNICAKEFAGKLLKANYLNETIELSNNVRFFRPLHVMTGNEEEIENFGLNAGNIAMAQRMANDGEVYHSISYV